MSVSRNADGVEGRKSTSTESGIDKAEGTVLEVAVWRPSEVARVSNSLWYWTFSTIRGS